MCKIMLIINKNKKNNEAINDLLLANSRELEDEKDGYSIFRNDKTFFYNTSEAYDNLQENIQYQNEYIYIIHTRTKTAGSDGLDGLHLQTIANDYVYAHNGTVSKYSSVKSKSDSYYFFKHLIKKYTAITIESIVEHMKDTGFYGKGVLYNKATKELHYFCNQESHITILPDCLIFSTFEIDTKKQVYKQHSVLGYSWYTPDRKIEVKSVLKKEKKDDHYFYFIDGQLISHEKMPNTYAGYSNSYNSNTSYSVTPDDYYQDKEELAKDLKLEGFSEEEIKEELSHYATEEPNKTIKDIVHNHRNPIMAD